MKRIAIGYNNLDGNIKLSASEASSLLLAEEMCLLHYPRND
jgi:hypothetical protein